MNAYVKAVGLLGNDRTWTGRLTTETPLDDLCDRCPDDSPHSDYDCPNFTACCGSPIDPDLRFCGKCGENC